MAAKKRSLGRGLDALLGVSSSASVAVAAETAAARELKHVPLDLIRRGACQPRRDMDNEALEELAQSIRVQGVLQPIVLRPVAAGKYEIIAGERRWRAAQLTGLDTIPALIRNVPDDAAMAMALIENIQREDLNPIEEATAMQRLQQEFELTQQQLAEALGKSRTTVTNLLRLMSLADDVRRMLERGELEMGHARALLGLSDAGQSAAARTVVGKGLSVRQTEALVRQLQAAKTKPKKTGSLLDPNVRTLRDELSARLGTGVQIQHTAKGSGKLILPYSSLDELDGILKHIK